MGKSKETVEKGELTWRLFRLGFFLIAFTFQSYHCSAQYDFLTISNTEPYNFGIRTIGFDFDSNIWLGTTSDGLMKYTGFSVLMFTSTNSDLAGDMVYSIHAFKNGSLYIGTNNGLSVFHNSDWQTYTTENSSIPGNWILSMKETAGSQLWIGTNNGVVNGLFGTVYNPSNSGLPGLQVLSIEYTRDSTLWFATEGGIASYKEGIWNSYLSGTGGIPAGVAGFIEEDIEGNIWVSMGKEINGSLVKYSDGEWEVINTPGDLFNNARITGIVSGKNGEIWFGTHHEGVILLKENSWYKFKTSNSNLEINQIMSVEADSSGTIWFGTQAGLIKVTEATGINTQGKLSDREILIYPVPVDDVFTIELPGNEFLDIEFRLIDLAGRLIMEVNRKGVRTLQLVADNIDPGIYYYEIIANSNYYHGKIVFR